MISRVFFLALFGLLSALSPVLAGTSAEGLAYLAAKAKEEGVVTLPSGLMYKELHAGMSSPEKICNLPFYTTPSNLNW